jgi:hypothetical protein
MRRSLVLGLSCCLAAAVLPATQIGGGATIEAGLQGYPF